MGRGKGGSYKSSVLLTGMDRLYILEKRSFRYENDDENRKTKRSFIKTIFF